MNTMPSTASVFRVVFEFVWIFRSDELVIVLIEGQDCECLVVLWFRDLTKQ